MSDEKAERIKDKIAASQARSTGKAPRRKGKPDRSRPANRRSLFDRALDDHPLALLAGGIVIGAVVAAVTPRRFGAGLGKRLLGFATLAAELGSLYGGKALDAAADGAREGREKLGDLGETLADQGADARRRAAGIGALAGRRVVELAGVATKNARGVRGGAIKALTDLRDRARH